MAQECSEFSDFNNAPGFNGLSVSFAQFVAPFSERTTALALMTPPLLLTRRCDSELQQVWLRHDVRDEGDGLR